MSTTEPLPTRSRYAQKKMYAAEIALVNKLLGGAAQPMTFTMRWVLRDAKRVGLWLVALLSVATTAAIYQWRPGWALMMRIVSWIGAAVALAWLWMPACRRWVIKRWSRKP